MIVNMVQSCLIDTIEEVCGILPNPYVLVAVSKGMWAVKLCSDKILQLLTLVLHWYF